MEIRDAVIQPGTSKGKGLLQKLFAVWFDAFVYNQIWEDPRVDIEALSIDPESRILTISSGGCNALNYLLHGPRSVTAVDLNRHHICLLNLKIAALRGLPGHDQFFALFGHGKSNDAADLFETFLAPNLDEETRRFWESKTFFGRLSHGRRIDIFSNGGLYDHSRNGYFLKFFQRFAHFVGCRPEAVLEASNESEQAELFAKHVDPFFDSAVIKFVGKLPVTMFGLGIPPQQYAELKKDLNGGSIIDLYRRRVRKLAVSYPIGENYFAWQAFARRYDTKQRIAVPDYLKPENFDALRSAAERLETRVGSVTAEIAGSEPGRFNRFVFLDAQDWMDPAALTELWSAIAERGEPGSRIIFRTAGAVSPIESGIPESLRQRFTYAEDESRRLFEQDRASIYGGFHLYVLN